MSDGLNEIFKDNYKPKPFDVELALKLSKIVHNECKDVPHGIGIKLAQAVEFYNKKD